MKDFNNVKDNPDIEMGTTFEFGDYVCEVDDFNYDNPNESIVFIYKSQKDYENGDYIEQVSLQNKNIKTNIQEYMMDNYNVIPNKITRLALLLEIQDQLYHNMLSYSKNYLMTEPKPDFKDQWYHEKEKLELLDKMIKEEKIKDKKERSDKDDKQR